ncbi:unnamed protein product [Rodentolepis nana]|uniref:Reverse transcriptase domain-containing protein n=1 Tax=Rodentolepis nana TaxID=102285 RepID=A0A0R3TD02_RODNA|nr:unnamed protein product [Rodentolepis nana]
MSVTRQLHFLIIFVHRDDGLIFSPEEQCLACELQDFDRRHQRLLLYGNALSQFNLLQTGLPQGAVTSSTLFNVLFNDIAELVQTVTGIKCLLYADDLVQWYSAPKKNAQERTDSALKGALKLLANWCDNNGMVINTAKNAFQTFSLARHSIKPLQRYKDTSLEIANEFTYLGMTFDIKLTWKVTLLK